jgi:hypothetical protein
MAKAPAHGAPGLLQAPPVNIFSLLLDKFE